MTIELSSSSFDALQEYATSVDKSCDEVATAIVESALLHFMAGKLAGLDAAKKIYRKK